MRNAITESNKQKFALRSPPSGGDLNRKPQWLGAEEAPGTVDARVA